MSLLNWNIHVNESIKWDELEALQKRCHQVVVEDSKQGHLLISQLSETVLTAGRSAQECDLLQSREYYDQENILIKKVSRGGQWTCHGPGQWLVYPVVSLKSLGLGSKSTRKFIHEFREALFESLVRTQSVLKKTLRTQDCPFGIYQLEKKVASFGMSFPRGISQHGAAIYIYAQLDAFKSIVPCGCRETELGVLSDTLLIDSRQWVDEIQKSVCEVF